MLRKLLTAAHAGAADVHGGCPTHVIEDLEEVTRHLRGAVAYQGARRLAHAPVVDDEYGVFRRLLVPEIERLPLPGCVENSQAVDELWCFLPTGKYLSTSM